jgi:hypothetical protein
MANLFERLSKGRPQPVDIQPKANSELSQAQKLLDWLQHVWTKPTVSARDIYRHGPYVIRKQGSAAVKPAEVLVRRGWLVPAPAHRHDRKKWLVVRGPTPDILFRPEP